MFETDEPKNYEAVYAELMGRLADWNFERVAPGLGLSPGEDELEIPFFNRRYILSRGGITDASTGLEPEMTHRIVICYYVLHGGSGEPAGEWVTYRDFGDSRFFMDAYRTTVEAPLAVAYSGRKGALVERCGSLGGELVEGPVAADVCARFLMLPRMPLLLVFNDADEDFPADARVLFDRAADRWLDMECLAVSGIILSDLLVKG